MIAGEGNGPMAPDARPCGVVIAGTHPVAVDCVAATLMGFDWQKLALLRHAFELRELDFTDFSADQIKVHSNRRVWDKPLAEIEADGVFSFRPHFGWVGVIEAKPAAVVGRD